MTRGLQILEGKQIVENEDGSFAVPSQTSKSIYEVRLLGQAWACTCPDFEFRHIDACKHIFAVKMFIAASVYLKEEAAPKVFAADAMPCVRCGSIRVIHYGKRGAKQVYFCKDCKRKFGEQSLLKKVQFTPELITLTLDLYFSGLSLRKVARNVSDHLNVNVGYTTIYSWIQRYIPMIAEYVNALTPELSKEWHADELFVKVRGGSEYKGNKSMGFLWNIMDRQTRYLIASKVSKFRDMDGAIVAFQEAMKNVHGNTPEVVYTDSLRSYYQAIPKGAKHTRNCGVGKPHETNNRIERMNGTLRERTKVQRGWKKMDTPLSEGQRIQYNFVKPHMALEGKTPANAAGLRVKGWKELIERAMIKHAQ
jgi:transposase-like protein